MTKYQTDGGSMTVSAEQIKEAGQVLVYDQHGQSSTEYACAGDFLVNWPDSSSNVVEHERFTQLFPQLAPATSPQTKEVHAR